MVSLEVKGIEAMRKNLERSITKLDQILKDTVKLGAQDILDATDPPVVSGKLASTGHVTEPIREDDTVYSKVVYGGDEAPYTLKVHETPNAKGSHKFLQRPFEASVDKFQELVKDKIINGLD